MNKILIVAEHDGTRLNPAIAKCVRCARDVPDANVTVLIGTVVLFALGAGPVKGFAITLAIGILSSQFTAIVGSRALAQLAFARRQLKEVPIW